MLLAVIFLFLISCSVSHEDGGMRTRDCVFPCRPGSYFLLHSALVSSNSHFDLRCLQSRREVHHFHLLLSLSTVQKARFRLLYATPLLCLLVKGGRGAPRNTHIHFLVYSQEGTTLTELD